MNKDEKRRDVFVLVHRYEYGEEDEYETEKNLGVYTSYAKAEDAIERYFKLPGFCKYPKECFVIEEYFYDKDMWWSEGFVKEEERESEFEMLTICVNEWQGITEIPEKSWGNDIYYNMLCRISEKVYKIKSINALGAFIQEVWERTYSEKKRTWQNYLTLARNIENVLELDLQS